MPIIRTRDEFLPVTCAILKDDARRAFFGEVQKLRGGRPDQLGRLLGVPASLVHDWIAGNVNIPYHFLQKVAHEFNLDIPPVSELRREVQAVVAAPPPKRPLPEAKGKPAKPKEPAERGRKARGGAKAEAQPRRQKQRRQQAGRKAEPKPGGRRRPAVERKPSVRQAPGRQPKEPPREGGLPSPSEELAYWVGVLLSAASREGDAVVLSADRRMGQNFAGTWAKRTKALFGRAAALATRDNGKVQVASLPLEGLEEFVAKLGFGSGAAGPAGDAGVPRWVWSNPAWKTACVRGVVDAVGRFHRAPSLSLALSADLAKAVAKILAGLGFKLGDEAGGGLVIAGKEQLEKYYDEVGLDNLKLKDQVGSYLGRRGRGAPAGMDAQAGDVPGGNVPDTELGQPGDAEASDAAGAAPSAETVEPASEPPEAAGPGSAEPSDAPEASEAPHAGMEPSGTSAAAPAGAADEAERPATEAPAQPSRTAVRRGRLGPSRRRAGFRAKDSRSRDE